MEPVALAAKQAALGECRAALYWRNDIRNVSAARSTESLTELSKERAILSQIERIEYIQTGTSQLMQSQWASIEGDGARRSHKNDEQASKEERQQSLECFTKNFMQMRILRKLEESLKVYSHTVCRFQPWRIISGFYAAGLWHCQGCQTIDHIMNALIGVTVVLQHQGCWCHSRCIYSPGVSMSTDAFVT